MTFKFQHDLIELPKLERLDGLPGGRFYKTPTGLLYPSVTTILGTMADKSGLDEWVSRVGQEEATRKTNRSARRGTEVHRLCEDFILNRELNLRREMPINVHIFKQFQKQLTDNVNNIRGSELFLYSDKFKYAGACDLIAEWQGKLSIIDFKTSDKTKNLDWIHGYWHQTSLYAIAFHERTGIPITQLVLIIGLEEEDTAQVLVGDIRDWGPAAIKITKKYHLTH